jgi:hypothetical protein
MIFELVGQIIHFSMGHYGYYLVCISLFYKNSEYPSLRLERQPEQVSARKDASGCVQDLLFGNKVRGIQI